MGTLTFVASLYWECKHQFSVNELAKDERCCSIAGYHSHYDPPFCSLLPIQMFYFTRITVNCKIWKCASAELVYRQPPYNKKYLNKHCEFIHQAVFNLSGVWMLFKSKFWWVESNKIMDFQNFTFGKQCKNTTKGVWQLAASLGSL